MELFQASNQWATRPDDERFRTLEGMRESCYGYYDSARSAEVEWGDLRVEAVGDEVMTVGKTGVSARLSHHAFGQLSARVGAPARYLRTLPPTLVAQNLNHGFKERGQRADSSDREDTKASLLLHTNGSLLLRAATSDRYERVWNWEVLDRLIPFTDAHGLMPAQATFNWSQRSAGSDQDGATQYDEDADRALYASDHDMFAFVMSPERTIKGPMGEVLRRGVIVQNSEVGAASLRFMTFLFRDLCCNHIIWGAEGVQEVSLRHTGKIRNAWGDKLAKVTRYLDGAASLQEAQLEQVRIKLGNTKEEVLDRLFGIRKVQLSRKALEAGYDAVVPDEDGDPNTLWGVVQGLTRHSQTLPFADERQVVDRQAGKLLTMAF